ncbi:hypothetical protein GCM10007082_09400 [Oceanisphaera arctica]|nr:hypothetical protein GCM10007082_09400 [Oceanisphaera arctica]
MAGGMVATGFKGSLARGSLGTLAKSDEHIAKNVTPDDKLRKVKSPASRGLLD